MRNSAFSSKSPGSPARQMRNVFSVSLFSGVVCPTSAPPSARQNFGSPSHPLSDVPSKMDVNPSWLSKGRGCGPRGPPRPCPRPPGCPGAPPGGCVPPRAGGACCACAVVPMMKTANRAAVAVLAIIRGSLLNSFPLFRLRGLEDRVGDVIRRQAVAERRRQALARCRRIHEIRELVRERVLVADLQARHPPVLHVRLIAVGDVNVAPAAHAPV